MPKLFSLFLIFSFFIPSAGSQVVMSSLLTQDHKGVINESINHPGEQLQHQWQHQQTTGLKHTYLLSIYHNDELINTYEVRMRNLSITFYIEVRMPYKQDGNIKTLSGIYDKGNKWMRVKMAPHVNCKREDSQWGRLDKIDQFSQILDYLIRQLDENVVLDCYAQ